jgi:16S rRNA (guanine527-N7)-methyltransferase
MSQAKVRLIEGMTDLSLTPKAEAVDLLMQYLELLAQWNRVYNLTAVRDIDQMVTYHLLDSLAIVPFVQGERILDIGSGAGLPGIPLAIMFPDITWVLLDSNGKKTRFLQQAIAELGLANITVVQARIQDYQPSALFDIILARALSSLHDIIHLSGHCCRAGGRFLCMKGVLSQTELSSVSDFQITTHALKVPGMNAQRHLVIVDKTGSGDYG